MGYFDSTATGALQGAGTGASIGSFFGPGGTAIGGIGGGILGGILGYGRAKGGDKKKAAVGQARLKLEELARSQRAQRMADLDKTMSFFSPVEDEMTRLYGRR